jgi:dienelactone hydrolase
MINPIVSTLIIFLSINVIAAESDINADSPEESEQSRADTAMLRDTGTIIGFQPLTVAGQEVDASFIDEQLGEQRGAVIILHNIGEGIDNKSSLSTIRTALPKSGWATMTLALDYPFESTIYLSEALDSDDNELLEEESANSVQPTPTEEAITTDAAASNDADDVPEELPPVSNSQRIESALAFLKGKELKRIILVGYGKGGEVAVEHLSTLSTPMQGLILISTAKIDNKEFFDKLSYPVVDIYGERDAPDVLEAITQRRVWMKQQQKLNLNYFQREIVGADTLFYGFEQNLYITVRSWLNSQFVEPKDN